MKRKIAVPDFHGPEPTPEELALLERWELEELLEIYARPPDDPSYRD